MITLDDLMPNDQEWQLVSGMPDQVAVGYLRAKRKREQSRSAQPGLDLGDLFGGVFGRDV